MATAPQAPSEQIEVHHLSRKPAPAQDDALVCVIERALRAPDFDVAKLQQLLELKERIDANEARKAFFAAMAEFQLNAPTIKKNKHVKFTTPKGTTEYDHSTLDHVCDTITASLAKYGISRRWKMKQEKEWITVTCILRHNLGHTEETPLMGTADLTGSKNAVQAIASTVTYLERYTLLAATGLASADSDNDGRGAETRPDGSIPEDRVLHLMERIENAQDIESLWRIYSQAYREADLVKDRAAMASYIRVKDARKAELQCQ